MRRITIQKTKISDGHITVIEIGHSYKCILHPEHFKKLKALTEGEVDYVMFRDEQKMAWAIEKYTNGLRFKELDQGYEFTISGDDFDRLMAE